MKSKHELLDLMQIWLVVHSVSCLNEEVYLLNTSKTDVMGMHFNKMDNFQHNNPTSLLFSIAVKYKTLQKIFLPKY